MTNVQFQKAEQIDDYKEIYDHNLDVFSDSPDFKWDYESIRKEVNAGWELYSVKAEDGDIIAAVFFRQDGQRLLTKNTSLKMNYQGSGYSHKIKEFFEDVARNRKLKEIVHYCGIDNFRMYSLNESHGYKKTPVRYGDKGRVVEWVKPLRKKAPKAAGGASKKTSKSKS